MHAMYAEAPDFLRQLQDHEGRPDAPDIDIKAETKLLVDTKRESMSLDELAEDLPEAMCQFPELNKALLAGIRANDIEHVGFLVLMLLRRRMEVHAAKMLSQGRRFDEVWS